MADSRVPCSNDAAGKKAAVGVMGGKHATHESCIQSEAWHLSRRDWDIYHHTHSRTNIASLEPRSIPPSTIQAEGNKWQFLSSSQHENESLLYDFEACRMVVRQKGQKR
eukprot:scaffold277913_cov30-Tisochrysis_lutea.AAC.2